MSVLAGCLLYEACGFRHSSAYWNANPTRGFTCYRGFRALALVAFLSLLAWRFSFRLLDAGPPRVIGVEHPPPEHASVVCITCAALQVTLPAEMYVLVSRPSRTIF